MEIIQILAQNKELGPVLMALVFAAGVALGVYRIVSKSSLVQRNYDLTLQSTIRQEVKQEYAEALTEIRRDNQNAIARLEARHAAEIEEMHQRLQVLEQRFDHLKTPLLRINQLVAQLPQSDPVVIGLSREIQNELREALEKI